MRTLIVTFGQKLSIYHPEQSVIAYITERALDSPALSIWKQRNLHEVSIQMRATGINEKASTLI